MPRVARLFILSLLFLTTLISANEHVSQAASTNAIIVEMKPAPDAGLTMTINRGTRAGLTPDTSYYVFQNGMKIGTLRITQISDGTSEGTFTAATKGLQPEKMTSISLAQSGTQPIPIMPPGIDNLLAFPEEPAPAPNIITEDWLEKPATTTTRNTPAPTSGDIHRLGPGDVLKIDARPKDQLPDTITVRPDGYITLPFVGKIDTQGLTVYQLSDIIQERMEQYFRRPWVELTVISYRSRVIRILGDIARPGEYPLEYDMKALDFFSHIGGLSDSADLSAIKVFHSDGTETLLNLEKIIINPNDPANIVLLHKDFIYVPAMSKDAMRIILMGEVNKQGIYKLNREDASLLHLISEAGGLAKTASMHSIFVVRRLPNDDTQTFTLDISSITRGIGPDTFSLANGDIVYIPPVSETKAKKVLDEINKAVKDILPLTNFIWFVSDN